MFQFHFISLDNATVAAAELVWILNSLGIISDNATTAATQSETGFLMAGGTVVDKLGIVFYIIG